MIALMETISGSVAVDITRVELVGPIARGEIDALRNIVAGSHWACTDEAALASKRSVAAAVSLCAYVSPSGFRPLSIWGLAVTRSSAGSCRSKPDPISARLQ